MNKKHIILLILLGVSQLLFSQSFSGKGDQKVQAGFNFYGYGTGIKANYDYGLNNTFSIGIGGVFYNTGLHHSGMFIFGRGDYHFQEVIKYPEELDVYLGLELGLVGSNYFGLGGHIGGRYDFSSNLYAYAELGYNAAIGVGINL